MRGEPMLILGWRLGGQAFGLDVRTVIRIEEAIGVRTIPRPSRHVAGLTYYQGRIVPVINLATLLLDESDHVWPSTPVHLIMQSGAAMLAARVDSVIRMFRANTQDLVMWSEPPDHPAAPLVRALLPTEEATVWVMDIRRIARRLGLNETVSAVPDTPYARQGAQT